MNTWISTPAGGGSVDVAQIDISDHAFTVGDGVYETLRTDRGKPMWLERHLERLQNSVSLMQISGPSEGEIRESVAAVCESATVGRLRITISSGAGPAGLARGAGWTLVTTWQPLPEFASSIRLAISSIRRNQYSPIVHAKVISLAENVLAVVQAKAKNADDALLLNLDGNIAESASSNFFLVRDGKALTPPLSAGVLPGTVRGWLLERGFASEAMLTTADLVTADEAFITSATRLITQVAEIDDYAFNTQGSVSSAVREALFTEVR